MRYKIQEIFYSIQGEGIYTGAKAIFVRFHGCNLNCPFCDTKQETNDFELLYSDQILQRIGKLHKDTPTPIIVLTGGEPMQQLYYYMDLVKRLKHLNYEVHLETNGTYPVPDDAFDWVTCSPKDKKIMITRANEVKFLCSPNGLQNSANALQLHSDYYCIQPIDYKNEKLNQSSVEKAIEILKTKPNNWRLSCQIHKFLNLR